MPLLKDGRVIEDTFRSLDAETPLPTEGAWMVSWARWLAEGETLAARPGLTLALRVPGETAPAEVAAAAEQMRAAAVAVVFPSFRDGRGFSLARLLRERYGFAGELRAEGPLLPDQYAFLHRCGFDAVAPQDESRLRDWDRMLAQIGVVYQPAADRRATVLALRHGAASAIQP